MKEKSIFIMGEKMRNMIYSNTTIKKIGDKTDIVGFYDSKSIFEAKKVFRGVKYLFSGWDGVKIDNKLMRILPDLRVVFYGAGTIREIQTPEMWDANIRITSSASCNAIPVANFTTSVIILAMKNYFRLVRDLRNKKEKGYDTLDKIHGFYNGKIGIISYSKIGKLVIDNLRESNNEVLLYDPYIDERKCNEIGVKKSNLEEIFKSCDVISIHTPLIDQTRNMIDKDLLKLMKKDATIINTARGGIIVEEDLVDVLSMRKDLLAIIDVTDPNEPADHDSPLYIMDNIILSPHIAGSQGKEIFALGDNMLDELCSYLESGVLKDEIKEDQLITMA